MSEDLKQAATVPKEEIKPAPVIHEAAGYDIDKLSNSVSNQETAGCTLGYGKEYNNCHGIKNGNTAPCPKVGRNNMCIYSDPSESHAAFKIIWKRWYDGLPTLEKARRWSGNDRAEAWLRNVMNHYNKS